jgi:hypothetical protein
MHIDFLSVSFPKIEIHTLEDAARFGAELYGERWADMLESNPRDFYRTPATPPFNACIHSPLGSINWKRNKPGVLVMIPGKACQALDDVFLMHVCQEYKITRIDIAHDLYNFDPGITPAYIVAKHNAKSFSEAHSATGDTYYLGSPKSDAMTRVYMYAPPNPRAGIPRVEHQYRRKAAEQVARQVAKGLIYDVYETRTKALNLAECASATTDYTKQRIISPTRTDDDSKKAAWILKSVRPTLCRLLKEGIITARDLFDGDTWDALMSNPPRMNAWQ